MTIYFVRAGKHGPVKIGYTSASVLKRVAQMQTGSLEPMILLGTIEGTKAQERSLQARFKATHLRGEWFLVDEGLSAFLSKLSPPEQPYVAHMGLLRKQAGSPFEPGVKFPRGRKRAVSDEVLSEIKNLVETTDLAVSAIAKRFDMPSSSIHYYFPDLPSLRKHKIKLGRPTQITRKQFDEIERRLLETTEPIASIAKRIKVGKKAISAPTINAWFPGWRSKNKAERAAFRRSRPLPET